MMFDYLNVYIILTFQCCTSTELPI